MMPAVLSRLLLVLVLLPLVVIVEPAPVAADDRYVACPARKVQTALRLPAARPLRIIVTGQCLENLLITRDDVTIVGGPSGATISGLDPAKSAIHIDGAKNVVIENLTVRRGLHGIAGVNGARFAVRNSIVHENVQNGVLAVSGSVVTVDGGEFANNGKQAESGAKLGRHGVAISDNSSAVVVGAMIGSTTANLGNADHGVFVGRSSNARIGRTLANDSKPNTITGNGAHGVSVYQSSQALIRDNTVNGNAVHGIAVDLASSATIFGNRIESNGADGVIVSGASSARIGLTDSNTDQPRRSECVLTGLGTEPPGCTNAIRSNDRDGISLADSASVTMRGNLVQQNRRRGVSVARSSLRLVGDNVIDANVQDGLTVLGSQVFQGPGDGWTDTVDRISGNGKGTDPPSAYGILLFDGSYGRFDNVDVIGNGWEGILVAARSGVDLRNSLVQDNGRTGVNVSGTSSTDIRNSEIRGNGKGSNGQHGIRLASATSADIRDTFVTDNGADGLRIEVGANATVRNMTATQLMKVTNNQSGAGVRVSSGSVLNLFRGYESGTTTVVPAVQIEGNAVGIVCGQNSVLAVGSQGGGNLGGAGVTANTENFQGNVLVTGSVAGVPAIVPQPLTASGGTCQ